METLLIVLCVLVFANLILVIVFRPKLPSGLSSLPHKIDLLQHTLSKIELNVRDDFRTSRMEIAALTRENRAELAGTLGEMKAELASVLREKFGTLEEKQLKLVEKTESKLEQMRQTVDEKLTRTLNERLGQSFEQVGKHLENVQKGLGEMQHLAADVGGLKKVLANVKIRGGIGEVQLAMLLEQVLAPVQYEANVRTKAGSRESVEFAIKFPGSEEHTTIYLPVDAKFPKDVYERLVLAYEAGATEEIEAASRNLETTLRRMAKEIRDKYIDPPHTTDFAVLFLPFESIYAEVIRRTALVDQLQQEYKITVAGPTTFAAILNSLQMGFRTLALQQRTRDVWQVLGAVKTEFDKFGGLLEKAQKNIHAASDTVDDLLGKRTRAISRKLREIEALPDNGSQQLLPDPEAGGNIDKNPAPGLIGNG